MSTKRERYSVLNDVAPSILSNLGSVGRSLSRSLCSGNHGVFTSCTINPSGYSDWREYFNDYQAQALLKKFPGLNLPIDREAVAIEKFLKSEKTCSLVNRAFSKPGKLISRQTLSTLDRARAFVARCLGEFSWDTAICYADFGPGASVGIPRKRSHLCDKIGMLNPTVTGECSVLLDTYKRFDPHVGEAQPGFSLVKGSRATTVPKDARSDRFIAIEPLWNMFFQKGIGGMIRKRLKAVGLDLDTGQTINRRLALHGSISGSLSTIDLSSASDCISLSLVEYLLPEDWFRAMMIVRSPYCTLPNGETPLLGKISSMGNGFTFELESLIFYSLVRSISSGVPGRDVSVFGDDIIIPSKDAGLLIDVLQEVGFKTNLEKTFIVGPFRESCGKHYFSGRDVTPFFLKKEVSSTLDLLWLVNSIKRLAYRFHGLDYGLDSRFKPAYDIAMSKLPKYVQSLSCPDGYGDDAVVRDLDEARPHTRLHSSGFEGFVSRYLSQKGRDDEYDGLPALITKLWFTRRNQHLGEMSQYSRSKPSTSKYRVKKRLYPQWPALGPWLE
jgi:hypothetical protein